MAWPRLDRRRLIDGFALAAACLAALPPLLRYGGHVHRGDHAGSAFQPRVDAMIEVSAIAAQHGPFCAIGHAPPFRAVERIQTDLGLPALADLLGRSRGAPITTRTLGRINLAFLAAALYGLIAVLPPPQRWGLVPVFLLVPLYPAAYASADIPTIHGAFALLALVLALATVRATSPWTGVATGALLFALSRFRSVYGYYAIFALLAATAWTFVLRRDRRHLRAAVASLLVMASLHVAWALALRARAADPRLADKDALGTHDVFKPLLTGIGWTDNRWGIAPWDPRVAQFIADRLGVAPIPIFTRESERRARAVYVSLWREAPLYLAGLYLARLPAAFRDHFFLGWVGAGSWLLATAVGLFWGGRRGEPVHSAITVAAAVLVLSLVSQSAILDPRLLYAYPLTVVSALALSIALTALVRLALPAPRS